MKMTLLLASTAILLALPASAGSISKCWPTASQRLDPLTTCNPQARTRNAAARSNNPGNPGGEDPDDDGPDDDGPDDDGPDDDGPDDDGPDDDGPDDPSDDDDGKGDKGNHYGNDKPDNNPNDDKNPHDGEQSKGDHHDNNGNKGGNR